MARGPFEWDEDIQRLGARVDDFFDGVIGLASAPRYLLQHSWRPAVDVYDVDSGLVVIAELPGVDDADLKVTLQNGRLRISGTRRPSPIERCKEPLQLEIEYGPFERLVTLPRDIDADCIEAHFRHGLLTVHLPQRETRRTIHVAVDDTDDL